MAEGPGFISYTVDNDRIFRDAIDLAKRDVEDLRIPLGLIANDFYKGQHSIFNLKGPGQYPDLNSKYKKHKRTEHGHVYPILKATGKLEEAAMSPSGILR